jgi:hypothetical protein
MKQQKTYTITTLKERTIEDGDCWEWTGYCANGTPSVFHAGKMIAVRRLFTELLGGKLREGYYVAKCGNGLCVNPEHTTYNDPKQHMKKGNRKALKSPTRRLKIQIYKRATNAKLTQEKADEIRSSNETSRVLAAKYGVDKSIICRIKSGQAWVNLSSPFASLIRT